MLRNSGHGHGSTRLRKTAGGGVAAAPFLVNIEGTFFWEAPVIVAILKL